jgi:hypothetical protein
MLSFQQILRNGISKFGTLPEFDKQKIPPFEQDFLYLLIND